ncbi:adenylate kinase [Spiroplasma platyhelix]|uniref:Adenylate kinase n=1 Tax=Spiroplasma platyhelix PALS-1 TaxID=1276218 RepID=A0A846TQQ8_9MOLU|nr:adenylate kinase [Spiroplasma platyhelix]MBE4704298.1 adenylate kinase [Spiroplasma platyhelix PALS-1]NKE38670.1 adenylate kinase [Spiroplasma platyhelix PALS-1]UJB28882.1 adenylate kinase [Spiroplasma platyhelix PALS-1]
MNLIILGPPGSGKGTQSDFLVEQYHFVHLSTGDLLRDEIVAKSEIGLSAKSFIDQGKYVPDDVMNGIIDNKITNLKDNFILDGYPRTIGQVKFLETVLQKINHKIDVVLYLEIKEQTIVDRLLARLVCPVCKTTYNRISMPPKVDTLCDKDQTPLIQRTDDTDSNKIVTRLNEYNVSTQPLVDYFRSKGLLKVIDANQDNTTIRQQLKQIIEAIHG